MGLDNDADLKRLQEELKRERERKEKLEKEVSESGLALPFYSTDFWPISTSFDHSW